MSAQTISLRLPEEEVAILNLLSDRERRTKTRASEILCPWDNRSPPNGCIQ